MTILLKEGQAIKERKQKLELEITKLIVDFSYETGIWPSHFNLTRKETKQFGTLEAITTEAFVTVTLDI